MTDDNSAQSMGPLEISGQATAERANGATSIQITPSEAMGQAEIDRVIQGPAPFEQPAPEISRTEATPAAVAPSSVTPTVVAQALAVPQMVLQKISEERKIKKGAPDPMGEIVTRIYVATDHFIIYTAETDAGDVGRLRYILPDDYASAKLLRALLTPIAGPLAFVSDVIASMRGWTSRLPWVSQYCMLRERTLDLCARAIQMSFEGQADAAKALVGRCLVRSYRTSR